MWDSRPSVPQSRRRPSNSVACERASRRMRVQLVEDTMTPHRSGLALLRLLHVPPEPEIIAGETAVQIFRAAPPYLPWTLVKRSEERRVGTDLRFGRTLGK